VALVEAVMIHKRRSTTPFVTNHRAYPAPLLAEFGRPYLDGFLIGYLDRPTPTRYAAMRPAEGDTDSPDYWRFITGHYDGFMDAMIGDESFYNRL
jgi:hypothetical protein